MNILCNSNRCLHFQYEYPVGLDCFLLLVGIWPSKVGQIKALFVGFDLLKYVRAGIPPDYASD